MIFKKQKKIKEREKQNHFNLNKLNFMYSY